MTEPQPPTPVRALGTTASVLILAVCATNIHTAWIDWNADGSATSDDYATVSYTVSVIALAAAAIAFLTWLSRARTNAERMNAARHRLSRGWVVGAWVCPIVNLWFPRRIVDDIWRTSHPGVPTDQDRVEGLPLSPLVRVWWLLMLADIGVRLLYDFTAETPRSVAVYSTISAVLAVGAAVALIPVIRQIGRWQVRTPATDEVSRPA